MLNLWILGVYCKPLSPKGCPLLQGPSRVQTYRVVEGHRIDDHEVLQVVLVGGIVPVPGHDIERGDILIAKELEKGHLST